MRADLNNKIAIGYLWNLLSKWLIRSLGLISTLCLVRILDPADFGLVALATIVLSFFVILSDAGTNQYLIKSEDCTSEMLDSAWSLNVALKMGCAVTVALLAYQVTHYLHEPKLYEVLLVSCFIPLVSSLKNIGLVLYERELDFKPLTQLSVSVKVVVVPVTLLLAFTLKNYWALVFGLIVSEVLTVAGSYLLHPYRPRWSTSLWDKQWSFSKWHLLSMTTGYVRSRIDALLLGRFLASKEVGMYRVSQEFAWLPFTELIAPATSSVYAGLTHVRDEMAEFHKTILRYLAISYCLVVPSAFFLYSFSDLFTTVVLGEKWQDASPLIGMLAMLMLSMPLNISLQFVLTNLSKIKYLVILDIVMIASTVGIILGLFTRGQLDVFLYTEFRMFLAILFITMLSLTYKWLIKLSFFRLISIVTLPMLPAFIMVSVLKVIQTHLDYPDIMSLFTLVVIGGAVYCPLMYLLTIFRKQARDEYAFIFAILRKLSPLKQ
ncbi:oligosaccharide flippase family protein [Vibrio alfacsensis]|uniref:oligosaccharide flippase family protein n=1 Tax=Vibrio alfacsensis TaxID=1074311 RepID=UPI004068D036